MRVPRISLAPPSELQSLLRTVHSPSRRCFSSATGSFNGARLAVATSYNGSFFLSNRVFERSTCLDNLLRDAPLRRTSTAASATTAETTTSSSIDELPPHRRRQARKQQQNGTPTGQLPPDASSLLAADAASAPNRSIRRKLSCLLSLSKPRLTVLVVLSAMATYALYPVPEMLSPSMTETPSLSPLTLLFLTTGTTLCSASANALNMIYEPSTDAKMSRTRNRPLVRGLLTTRSAVLFALAAGATGVGALYFGVNPTVSGLGAANIFLYAGMYTPLKTVTAFNTWIGAVVGGIPPLMGWAAAAGETATRDGSWRELLLASDGSSIGGWLMASLLFAWQFPHFMSLSFNNRDDYKAAGIRMLAWTNPARNARVALRYSLIFPPICVALCAAGVTSWGFALTSLPINGWLIKEAVGFWRKGGHQGSARGLFWASIWHLPGVMILAVLHKNGIWTRAYRSVVGTEEGEWEDEELEEMKSMTAERVAEKKALSKSER